MSLSQRPIDPTGRNGPLHSTTNRLTIACNIGFRLGFRDVSPILADHDAQLDWVPSVRPQPTLAFRVKVDSPSWWTIVPLGSSTGPSRGRCTMRSA